MSIPAGADLTAGDITVGNRIPSWLTVIGRMMFSSITTDGGGRIWDITIQAEAGADGKRVYPRAISPTEAGII
jgi:hypothetical protein